MLLLYGSQPAQLEAQGRQVSKAVVALLAQNATCCRYSINIGRLIDWLLTLSKLPLSCGREGCVSYIERKIRQTWRFAANETEASLGETSGVGGPRGAAGELVFLPVVLVAGLQMVEKAVTAATPYTLSSPSVSLSTSPTSPFLLLSVGNVFFSLLRTVGKWLCWSGQQVTVAGRSGPEKLDSGFSSWSQR